MFVAAVMERFVKDDLSALHSAQGMIAGSQGAALLDKGVLQVGIFTSEEKLTVQHDHHFGVVDLNVNPTMGKDDPRDRRDRQYDRRGIEQRTAHFGHSPPPRKRMRQHRRRSFAGKDSAGGCQYADVSEHANLVAATGS